MADLSGRAPADRGQLLLVTALGLAVLFVALALILNAAIHTEVLSTSAGGVDETGPLAYRAAASRETATLLAYTNAHDNASYGTLRANFTARVTTWQDLAGRLAAADAGERTLTVVAAVNGTRLEQSNRTRTYANLSGAPSWTLVENATSVRAVRANVSRDSLVDAAGNDSTASDLVAASAFAVVVDGSTGRWRAFVYRNATDVVVRVENDTGALGPRCRVSAPSAVVDVANASLGGRACPSLGALDDASGPFDLSFERGDHAAGTYALAVDRPVAAVDDGDVSTSDPSAPRATPLLYSATVRLTYGTPRLSYATTLHVDPEGAR